MTGEGLDDTHCCYNGALRNVDSADAGLLITDAGTTICCSVRGLSVEESLDLLQGRRQRRAGASWASQRDYGFWAR